MKTIYKVFLIIFIIFIGVNIYVINWEQGFFSAENSKFVFSMSAGLVGIFLLLVLNTWSKLASAKR